MRLTEVRFLQPGFDLDGRYRQQLTAKLDRVELTVTDLGLEIHLLQTGVTLWAPHTMLRQGVALRNSLACPHCGELFKSTGGMGNHIRIRHPDPVEPVVTGPAKAPRKKAANG